MTTDTTELALEVTHRFTATPEAVFDAWLNPEMLARFMHPADGMDVPKTSTDAREGGGFAITMRAGYQEIPHSGTYLTIDRPRRLVFTWVSPFSVEGSTVTLTLTPLDDGTELRLRHVRFLSEDERDSHSKGWSHILETLDTVL